MDAFVKAAVAKSDIYEISKKIGVNSATLARYIAGLRVYGPSLERIEKWGSSKGRWKPPSSTTKNDKGRLGGKKPKRKAKKPYANAKSLASGKRLAKKTAKKPMKAKAKPAPKKPIAASKPTPAKAPAKKTAVKAKAPAKPKAAPAKKSVAKKPRAPKAPPPPVDADVKAALEAAE